MKAHMPSHTTPGRAGPSLPGSDAALLYQELVDGATRNGHFSAFQRSGPEETLPLERWHFRDNVRVPPLLAVAENVRFAPRRPFPR